MRALTFGFSPCPNDTFAFHALVHGLVDAPFQVEPVLLDIEELNRRAHTGELDLTKLSFGAVAGAGGSATACCGAARRSAGGSGRSSSRVEERPLAGARIAIPGRETTAYLLLRLAEPDLGEVVELRYDRILGAVAAGEVDAGLIIHESRFTYADHGLVAIADLGAWWEQETGLPVPLAGIFARADLDDATAGAESAIRASVEYAFAHPVASRDYVRAHSQELSDEVCDAHIALYVNEFSVDLGDEGLAAIERLLAGAGRGAELPLPQSGPAAGPYFQRGRGRFSKGAFGMSITPTRAAAWTVAIRGRSCSYLVAGRYGGGRSRSSCTVAQRAAARDHPGQPKRPYAVQPQRRAQGALHLHEQRLPVGVAPAGRREGGQADRARFRWARSSGLMAGSRSATRAHRLYTFVRDRKRGEHEGRGIQGRRCLARDDGRCRRRPAPKSKPSGGGYSY